YLKKEIMGRAYEPSSDTGIPSLEQSLHQSEALGLIGASSQSLHGIAQSCAEASLRSEVSSMMPTSARLSIATTQLSVTVNSSPNGSETHPAIVDNPDRKVAAQAGAARRRNSLMSIRSFQPTLPPYEDHCHHLPVQDGAGPSSQGHEDSPRVEVSNIRRHHRNDAWAQSPTLSPRSPEDPENMLSAHYSRIVSTIDSRYTSELERLRQEIGQLKQSHAEELALIRNNMDSAYRCVFRKRDQEAERAKEEAASQVEGLERDVRRWKEENERALERIRREAALEKERWQKEHRGELERERHMVEDEWERRWLARMRLCDEEAERREKEGRKKRDDEWIAILRGKCPHVVAEMTLLMLQGTQNDVGGCQ
ncbi:MAG: hypothetical protein Q9163_005489, partial [Psora crenata]